MFCAVEVQGLASLGGAGGAAERSSNREYPEIFLVYRNFAQEAHVLPRCHHKTFPNYYFTIILLLLLFMIM